MPDAGLKLDLGCGHRLNPGHTGIDFLPIKTLFPGLVPPHYEGKYIEHDLFEFPWPIEDDSVEDVVMRYLVDFIPHRLPKQDPDSKQDGFFLFFEELYRVMLPYGKVLMVHQVPSTNPFSPAWNPSIVRQVSVQTWQYLSKDWRSEAVADVSTANFHLESAGDDGNEAVVVLSTVK